MSDLFTLDDGAALISPCGRFRYWLRRTLTMWAHERELLVWVMLNPSTADATQDDPTIRRVKGFTKREGFPGFVVVNVWALRATDPRDLHEQRGTITAEEELENLTHITRLVTCAEVVVAWGAHVVECAAFQRVCLALQKARRVRCLGLTKGRRAACAQRVDRQPRHPLMLRADTPLEPWAP